MLQWGKKTNQKNKTKLNKNTVTCWAQDLNIHSHYFEITILVLNEKWILFLVKKKKHNWCVLVFMRVHHWFGGRRSLFQQMVANINIIWSTCDWWPLSVVTWWTELNQCWVIEKYIEKQIKRVSCRFKIGTRWKT